MADFPLLRAEKIGGLPSALSIAVSVGCIRHCTETDGLWLNKSLRHSLAFRQVGWKYNAINKDLTYLCNSDFIMKRHLAALAVAFILTYNVTRATAQPTEFQRGIPSSTLNAVSI